MRVPQAAPRRVLTTRMMVVVAALFCPTAKTSSHRRTWPQTFGKGAGLHRSSSNYYSNPPTAMVLVPLPEKHSKKIIYCSIGHSTDKGDVELCGHSYAGIRCGTYVKCAAVHRRCNTPRSRMTYKTDRDVQKVCCTNRDTRPKKIKIVNRTREKEKGRRRRQMPPKSTLNPNVSVVEKVYADLHTCSRLNIIIFAPLEVHTVGSTFLTDNK